MLQRVTDATFKPPLGECWHVSKVRAPIHCGRFVFVTFQRCGHSGQESDFKRGAKDAVFWRELFGVN